MSNERLKIKTEVRASLPIIVLDLPQSSSPPPPSTTPRNRRMASFWPLAPLSDVAWRPLAMTSWRQAIDVAHSHALIILAPIIVRHFGFIEADLAVFGALLMVTVRLGALFAPPLWGAIGALFGGRRISFIISWGVASIIGGMFGFVNHFGAMIIFRILMGLSSFNINVILTDISTASSNKFLAFTSSLSKHFARVIGFLLAAFLSPGIIAPYLDLPSSSSSSPPPSSPSSSNSSSNSSSVWTTQSFFEQFPTAIAFAVIGFLSLVGVALALCGVMPETVTGWRLAAKKSKKRGGKRGKGGGVVGGGEEEETGLDRNGNVSRSGNKSRSGNQSRNKSRSGNKSRNKSRTGAGSRKSLHRPTSETSSDEDEIFDRTQSRVSRAESRKSEVESLFDEADSMFYSSEVDSSDNEAIYNPDGSDSDDEAAMGMISDEKTRQQRQQRLRMKADFGGGDQALFLCHVVPALLLIINFFEVFFTGGLTHIAIFWAASKVEAGGLGLSPYDLGLSLGAFQLLFLPLFLMTPPFIPQFVGVTGSTLITIVAGLATPWVRFMPFQPVSELNAYDHWLMVFVFAVLYTMTRWGAALMFSAVAKRTSDSVPVKMRNQVMSLVGLIRLAGSLLGPILVSVFNSLCLIHIGVGFYFGWAFVLCGSGLLCVMVFNWIILWRLDWEKSKKDGVEAGED